MIGVLGINHKTANIEIRESFYIAEDEVIPLSELIIDQTDVKEIVILSTCNRTEIYFYRDRSCKNRTIKQIVEILKEFKHIEKDFNNSFYVYIHDEAIKHLFEVVSGVDSLVLGENQIVNQVKECYLRSTKAALTGAILMRLFQKSFETSKKVRTKTRIQQGATSVSYVAIDWCYKRLGDLSQKNILLIGTGETGKIALNYLSDKGAKNFYMVNRTYETAEKFAKLYKGNAIRFENFKEHLPECDIVITATSAKNHLITKSDVEKYINGKPNIFVDLSVPRNIDDGIKELQNAEVVSVDDLQGSVDYTNKMRFDSLDKASTIIREMTDEFKEWFEHRRLRPVINSITKNINTIQKNEIENSRKFYGDDEIKLMDEYGERLAQKYARNVIKQLKALSTNEKDDSIIEKVQSLFLFND
ncbi:glutamyl-tRNA reductase [Saccharicrinis sp. FJH62]|uniref:glutamyl-tRNA reductase n=1 Tax=Saccharicrinis sp. FJH62 TaxID=3344657 RepID=UPI0035D4B1DA